MSVFTDFEKQLAYRTICNLDFIQKNIATKENNIFEVTQLINSLLGIIISIKESELFDYELTEKYLSDIDRKEWGIPDIPNKYNNEKNIYSIVYHLRNAAAHLNIYPQPTKGDKIQTITFQSKDIDTKEIIWSCVFSIEKLDKFLRKLTDYIQKD